MFSLILHGKKLLQVQKCCTLKPLQNAFAFSSSAAADGRKGKSIEDKSNAKSVMSLLRTHGFTKSQISSVITGYPQLLKLDAEKSVAPKLKFLQSRGASSSELAETLSKVPKILSLKGDESISVYYDFVKEIVEADKSSKHIKLCHSLAHGSRQENILRNVSALRDLGVPQRFLFSSLISGRYACYGKEKFETSLKKVVGLGFDPTTAKFFEALRIVGGFREETIEEKVNVYKKLGLAVEDIWAMFKKFPACLQYSEKKITQLFETFKECGLVEDEILSVFKNSPNCITASEQNVMNTIETFLGLGFSRDEIAMMVKHSPTCLTISAELIKKKIEFVVKKMNWPLKAVVTNPAVIGRSLEKRIIPRCNVITSLMAKGLIGAELPGLWSVCCCTDQVFLKRYVWKHDDKELMAEVIAIFNGKKSKTSE